MVTKTEQHELIEETEKRKIYREREQLRKKLTPVIRALVPDNVKAPDVSYLNSSQLEKFYEAVVDKVVVNLWGRERSERTRPARSLKRGDFTLDPLHIRWEEWFKKAGFTDPEKYIPFVDKYGDSVSKDVESNSNYWPVSFNPSQRPTSGFAGVKLNYDQKS